MTNHEQYWMGQARSKSGVLTDVWKEDCSRWYGPVLTGMYAHWCPDFDYLPMDETCSDFNECTCFKNDPTQE